MFHTYFHWSALLFKKKNLLGPICINIYTIHRFYKITFNTRHGWYKIILSPFQIDGPLFLFGLFQNNVHLLKMEALNFLIFSNYP